MTAHKCHCPVFPLLLSAARVKGAFRRAAEYLRETRERGQDRKRGEPTWHPNSGGRGPRMSSAGSCRQMGLCVQLGHRVAVDTLDT